MFRLRQRETAASATGALAVSTVGPMGDTKKVEKKQQKTVVSYGLMMFNGDILGYLIGI